MLNIVIYGAKSLALGMYRAIQKLYPQYPIKNFLVSSLENNSSTLAGLPVVELKDFTDKEACVLIATPEDVHGEIIKSLKQYDFNNYICMDSKKEAYLMEQYYKQIKQFPSLHRERPKLSVYMAKFWKDRPLNNPYVKPDWVIPIQVGAALTDKRVEKCLDNTGDNISEKNVNYCELTALYWMWKNKIQSGEIVDYYGLFHYRRVLDISETDIYRLAENDVDVVLSYPTIHEPDIYEHHTRYVKETDWKAMLTALEELYPEYAEAFSEILAQPYLYNYNMLIAKSKILAEYCAWLFPILERTEELSMPKGKERADRYIGYLGENLMTLYFLYHSKDLKIMHTGRFMLT